MVYFWEVKEFPFASFKYKKGEVSVNEQRIVKRYQNRKLYDMDQSCYVTLEELSQIIREGNDIKVIDNRDKSDITYQTQIQMLFELERKSLRKGDIELLNRVLRSDEGTLTGVLLNFEETQKIHSLHGVHSLRGGEEVGIEPAAIH